jgi:hypothetical protein
MVKTYIDIEEVLVAIVEIEQVLGKLKETPYTTMKEEQDEIVFGKCRNPTLAKCGGEAQHLEKVGIGVLRDSRKLRRRFGRPKHLALGCSWCHWKGLET